MPRVKNVSKEYQYQGLPVLLSLSAVLVWQRNPDFPHIISLSTFPISASRQMDCFSISLGQLASP